MILCIGQVERNVLEREGFQEIEYRAMYAGLAKWVGQIDRTERIPEYVSRAYHVALSGRPGPVVLSLPEDVLSERAGIEDAAPAAPVVAGVADEAMDALSEMLLAAERPLMIVGGSVWTTECREAVMAFAQRTGLPATASFRCQDYFDNRHRGYVADFGVGVNPKLVARARQSDLVISVGSRLGEITTSGFTLFDIPNPGPRLVHVHPSADELGRIYRPDLAINASLTAFAAKLDRIDDVDGSRWTSWREDARADYEAWVTPRPTPGAVKLEEVVRHVSEHLPDDAIVTNGAGNYTAWVHRYYQYRGFRTQLAPTSGSMGYGLPAAVAAKLKAPERPVVCFAGDGCFQMTGQELATAVQYELPIVIIVANNGMYATIRMHQERSYPGRVSGTSIHSPDFAALARSYGAHGERIEHTGEFPAAFARALACTTPALIELPIDPQALSPRMTLDEAHELGLKSQGDGAPIARAGGAASSFPVHGAG